MNQNFLNSPLLPGQALPKHEHLRFKIILGVILLVAVIVLVALLRLAARNSAPIEIAAPTPLTVSEQRALDRSKMVEQLRSMPPSSVTTETAARIINQFKRSKTVVSDATRASIINQFQSEF